MHTTMIHLALSAPIGSALFLKQQEIIDERNRMILIHSPVDAQWNHIIDYTLDSLSDKKVFVLHFGDESGVEMSNRLVERWIERGLEGDSMLLQNKPVVMEYIDEFNPTPDKNDTLGSSLFQSLYIENEHLIVDNFIPDEVRAEEIPDSLIKENVILVTSENQKKVGILLDELVHYTDTMKLQVIGLNGWKTFRNVDFDHYAQLNLLVSSYQNLDYTSKELIDYVGRYFKKYNTEPSQFAVLGYDLTKYFLLHLGENNRFYVQRCLGQTWNGIGLDLEMEYLGAEKGIRNKAGNMQKFEDFRFISAHQNK